jgi:AraC-like DNA-binding protein
LSADPLPAFVVHVPQPPLSHYVECLWRAQGLTAHKRERVLPNAVVEVIINLGSFHKILERDDYSCERLYRDSWVAGIQNRHLVIESVRETDLVGMRFRPGGAYALFGFPMSELADEVIELDLIRRQRFANLREELLQAGSTAAKFRVVEAMLLRALDFSRSAHPAVAHLADRIRAWDGAVRISELVEQVALSHKRLMQLFQRDVGMTPKALAQIYRFQSVLRRIARQRSPDWSRVAAECGYYDQPHLVHEFRRLSGLTPNEYLASRLPNLNHTVIE